MVHKSQISQTHVEDASDVLDVGEEVYCKVISIEVSKVSYSHNLVQSVLDSIKVYATLTEKYTGMHNRL